MPRTIVIGDIHGALKALRELINDIIPVPGDEFIFLGDYVDGWPDSAQVVEYLLDFGRTHQCHFIRGNHDLWCEQWLNGEKADPIWLQHGGLATIASYQHLSETEKIRHLAFFSTLENYFTDDQNRLFIHAGFATLEGPAREFRNGMYNWDRSLWEQALKMELASKSGLASKPELASIPELASKPDYASFPEKYKLYHEVYIGHTPTIFYQIDTPFQALNVINVDTGAGFNGKLSALDIGNGTCWQSSNVPQLYPGVKGRTY
ncbi:MAG: serine/threonine protein phosphatase [Sphingobacteriales bacterium]|nr:MAG: serine/threonine protein phosphatase [Sphingobacteriales bacterium]